MFPPSVFKNAHIVFFNVYVLAGLNGNL